MRNHARLKEESRRSEKRHIKIKRTIHSISTKEHF